VKVLSLKIVQPNAEHLHAAVNDSNFCEFQTVLLTVGHGCRSAPKLHCSCIVVAEVAL